MTDDQARPHHYAFAHRELPRACREFGGDLVAAAAAGTLDLVRVWNAVGEALPPGDRLPPDGLWWRHRDTPLGAAVLVGLPAPQRPAEAYYVLLLPPRTATLELGWDLMNSRWYTVLGAWDESRHLNYGAGPDPDPEAFVEAALARLEPPDPAAPR